MISFMSHTGLMVDLNHFASMEKELVADMDLCTEQVHDLTGYYINLDSGDQKSDLLFKKMGLKQARPKMTSSGERESVENEVLVAIQHEHPVVPLMLEYAELSKLLGTYVRPMPKLARHVGFGEWRMFPNFTTTRVPSGRLACKDPNLLAMPTRTERGAQIRKGFITKPGWVYWSVDESQIEVRLAAHLSQDPNLMKVYFNEEDVYSDFAITAFKLPDKRFRNDQGKWEYPGVHKMDHRYPAKTCILASIYDVSAAGLVEQMPIVCANCQWISLPSSHKDYTRHSCHKFKALWDEVKCQNLINAFYLKYPGVMADRMKAHQIVRKYGLLWDMWGRILQVAAVHSKHEWVVSAALREAGNFPYQSGAQGTVKLVMAAAMHDLDNGGLTDEIHVNLQVHDELVGEAKESIVDDWIGLLKWRFETCCRLNVPIKAGGVKAESWGSLPK
jgi:DNA polymerase-1